MLSDLVSKKIVWMLLAYHNNCPYHSNSRYLSPPPPPVVVNFFHAGVLFCSETWNFVANLRTFSGRWRPKIDKSQADLGHYPKDQGYHPGGGRGFEDEEDWSNGVPDQQGDYPADLGYYPKASSGQNPAFNGQPSHGGYHPQQQYHQQHFAGSSYIDQLSAQQQRYYWLYSHT